MGGGEEEVGRVRETEGEIWILEKKGCPSNCWGGLPKFPPLLPQAPSLLPTATCLFPLPAPAAPRIPAAVRYTECEPCIAPRNLLHVWVEAAEACAVATLECHQPHRRPGRAEEREGREERRNQAKAADAPKYKPALQESIRTAQPLRLRTCPPASTHTSTRPCNHMLTCTRASRPGAPPRLHNRAWTQHASGGARA